MNNVLLIGAHYDDTDLGVGGTAARLSAEGKNVYKLVLTDNFVAESEFNRYTDVASSLAENEKVCEILGIQDISDFPKQPNCNLEYSTELMRMIESVILEKKIDTVFMHSEYDMNHDHIVAAEITKVASRHVQNLLVYRSNIYITEKCFNPKVFFDISAFVEIKKKALATYGIEHQRMMAGGSNLLFDDVIMQNKIWGYCVDCMFAEAFEVIKFRF